MTDTAPPLEVQGLSKRFGRVTAVDELSFTVQAGRITGFLGPNGAGKTTTLRCLLGLVTPSAGESLVDGRPYRQLAHPGRVVGAALEATGFYPGRTARNHMRIRAAALYGSPGGGHVDELLEFVGLADAARRRVGGYSLGMRQRLTLAMALLGDPRILILDEPANGLDPAGIAWLRGFLRSYADQGRAVLVSSHLLAEVKQSVDDVVIVNRGRLVRSGPLSSFVAGTSVVDVAGPDLRALIEPLRQAGGNATPGDDSTAGSSVQRLRVTDLTAAQLGRIAFEHRVELHELTPRSEMADLEQVFLSLTEAGADGGDGNAGPGPGAVS